VSISVSILTQSRRRLLLLTFLQGFKMLTSKRSTFLTMVVESDNFERHLENFVRNANRENIFCSMIFPRDRFRTLASSGIRTNINLHTIAILAQSCRCDRRVLCFLLLLGWRRQHCCFSSGRSPSVSECQSASSLVPIHRVIFPYICVQDSVIEVITKR
jgi:hypothetical protein